MIGLSRYVHSEATEERFTLTMLDPAQKSGYASEFPDLSEAEEAFGAMVARCREIPPSTYDGQWAPWDSNPQPRD